MYMKQHVSKVAATCFYQLCRLRQIRRRVGRDVILQLVIALVIPRLDYCNSVLAALPSSTLHLLQRVQNTAAWLMFELRHHDHIIPALIQLHWLPIRWQIHYKRCTLMHAVHNGRCPPYLADIVSLTSHRQPEADCNRQTPRTTPHHVYVLNLASVRFPMQDQQPGLLYLPIYE